MLLEFRCKNFRSFKDESSLSMLPVNAYKELPSNMALVHPRGANADGVLSAAVIYGANASGKTNMLRAMDFARDIIVAEIDPGAFSDAIKFVGDNSPSEFYFSLNIEGTRFNYLFKTDKRGVIFEELKAQPKGERLVFRRELLENGSYGIKQGSAYSGIKTKLKGFSDNGLVLGLLSKFDVEDCKTVFNWFKEKLVINENISPIGHSDLLEKLKNLGEKNFERAINAVKSADLGISGAQLAVDDFSEEELENRRVATEKVKEIFEALTGKTIDSIEAPDKKITFQFQHTIGGNAVGFGLNNESLGTVAMLGLAADFLDAIAKGHTLVVDEIERSIHPLLLRGLISLFFDRTLNSANAQLIFTTHDLSLMESGLLRRDQIWFVEKQTNSGASELYPLSAYSPRKDDNIMNRYLYGSYGAVPFIDEELIHG